ncbi:hypothetical protein RhiirA4_526315 [Rhizophagus irregularis]|uniref:DUF8211 domain-containing protein n=1 Tax=Rhizophagus irregularis TaxID=588596 RepID=A0A2I1GQI2_9GLOM|nr:hypothetical protein RhiirA4_526315 [Rhizophagus irregularis]
MLMHFFTLQKVLPRRIQHKYFNLIRQKLLERIDLIKSRASNESLKNTSTKTFFNFFYKRYRFYFGIYNPCGHFYAPGLSRITSRCRGPSSFVMSNNRRACGAHQREFFHNHINNNLKSRPSEESTFINSKSSHANHLFDLWQCGYHQKVFSNRLGLTYTACFTANGTNFIRKHPKCVMYRKHFYDFKLTPSDNPRTRRKQETRFKRKCNRGFRSGKSDPLDNINDKLAAGRRYRFLFLGSQHIHKPIHHLKYKNFRYKSFPDHKEYPYKKKMSIRCT